MKDFAFLAGEPARTESYYIFAGLAVCAAIATGVRVALTYAGVGQAARSLIALAIFFPLAIAWGLLAIKLWPR